LESHPGGRRRGGHDHHATIVLTDDSGDIEILDGRRHRGGPHRDQPGDRRRGESGQGVGVAMHRATVPGADRWPLEASPDRQGSIMAVLRGPHLHTPLTLLTSDRDALSRVAPALVAAGADARYLVTRAGAAALREDEGGLLRPALETADPRGSTHQPLVLLGRRQGLRILAVEVPEPSAELDDPGRDL